MKKATKRADGRYQKSVFIGRKKDGSPIRKTVYASTQAELNRKVAELQHEAATGKCIHFDITFRRLSEIWMKQFPSLSKRWHKRKQCELDNHLLPALGDLKINELHLINLQNVLNDMAEQGYASSTMRKIKQCASAIMDFACDNDWLNRNCFLKAKVVSMEAPETRFLDDNEIRLITSSWEGHRFGIAAMIMLYCGLRRGEVLALEWDDIDYKTNVIHVTKARDIDANKAYLKKPKTKAGTRDVPIPTILLHALKKLGGKHGLIAPDKDGKLMSSTAYKRAWEGYFAYLNVTAGGKPASKYKPRVTVIKNITSKMLRHTYCTMLYDAGVDVKSAQYFMGHSNLETTLKIYTHLSQFRTKKSIASLNAHVVQMMQTINTKSSSS